MLAASLRKAVWQCPVAFVQRDTGWPAIGRVRCDARVCEIPSRALVWDFKILAKQLNDWLNYGR